MRQIGHIARKSNRPPMRKPETPLHFAPSYLPSLGTIFYRHIANAAVAALCVKFVER